MLLPSRREWNRRRSATPATRRGAAQAARQSLAAFCAEALEGRLLLSATPVALIDGAVDGPQGITMDTAGNLYGTALGVVWELAKGSSAPTTLCSFSNVSDGGYPTGITVDTSGNLYGIAINVDDSTAGGTVWELAKGGSAPTTLYTFPSLSSQGGGGALTGITIDGNGNLYGTENEVWTGNGYAPMVWELPKGSHSAGAIYSFTLADHVDDPDGIVLDSNGNIYGTSYGGEGSDGSIWELAKGGSAAITLYPFSGGSVGESPQAVAIDSSGDLYGATIEGGADSEGTIWELPEGSGAVKTLYSFTGGSDGFDGTDPSGITIDSSGRIYGTTIGGDSDGIVYEFAPNGGISPAALAFAQQPGNAAPGADLGPISVDVEDAGGNLVSTDSSSVTLSITGGPAGATLDGSATVAAVDGVATFSDLSIAKAGDNYTLTATDAALSPATSASFNITAGAVQSSVVPSFGAISLPPSVVAGATFKGKIPVLLTNQGSAFKGDMIVVIFADAGTSLDGNEVRVTSVMKELSFKADQGKTVSFSVKSLPTSLMDGTYHLLADVVAPSGQTSVVATTQTVQVAAAFVQPTVSVGPVTPSSISAGKSASISITITNAGNVAASGVDITLSPSADGVTPISGVILESVESGTKILPNKSKTFKLHFKSGALAAGNYYPYLSVTLDGVTTTGVGTAQFTTS